MSTNIVIQNTQEAFEPIGDKLTYETACAIGQNMSQNKSMINDEVFGITYEIACAIGQSLAKINSETTLTSKISDKK
jgi:hypothetical protein